MQSEICNHNVYSVYNVVYNEFSCQLLQNNAYSCSCLGTRCVQTCTCWCEMVLKFIGRECKQFCDGKTCRLNSMEVQCLKQHKNAIYRTRTRDTVTCFNSRRSNFISSAPSTASQGLATQISTVQRKDNSHTWCE